LSPKKQSKEKGKPKKESEKSRVLVGEKGSRIPLQARFVKSRAAQLRKRSRGSQGKKKVSLPRSIEGRNLRGAEARGGGLLTGRSKSREGGANCPSHRSKRVPGIKGSLYLARWEGSDQNLWRKGRRRKKMTFTNFSMRSFEVGGGTVKEKTRSKTAKLLCKASENRSCQLKEGSLHRGGT